MSSKRSYMDVLRRCVLLLGLVLVQGLALSQAPLRPPGLGITRDFETTFPNRAIHALGVYDSGNGPELYMGGEPYYITGTDSFTSRFIVKWNGHEWSRVGWGLDWTETGAPDYQGVHCMQAFDAGDGEKLYIGGKFDRYWSEQQGAWIPCRGFVAWDGTQFHNLFPYPSQVQRISSMLVYDDGSGPALYVGGLTDRRVYKITSQGASAVGLQLGSLGTSLTGYVNQLVAHDNGTGQKLYAAGFIEFVQTATSNGTVLVPANGLAVWDGQAWSPILGPWQNIFSNYVDVGRGNLVSYDDGSGPALYVGFDGGIWRYRYGVWENLIQTQGLNYHLYVLGVYDDGNGPALFVSGNEIPLPGVPPEQHVKFAKYQAGVWTQIGPATDGPVTHGVASRALVYDFGEGPDLYMCTAQGALGGSGQLPIRVARYRGIYRDVASVCGGDGSVVPCPCGPRGLVGHGCPNAANGDGAKLDAAGKPHDDTLRLTARAMPSTSACLLLQGDGYDHTPRFLGRGVLCATGSLLRLATQTASGGTSQFPSTGTPSLRALAAAQGDQLSQGSVRYYQVWYRDLGAEPCVDASPVNVTNAVRVVW